MSESHGGADAAEFRVGDVVDGRYELRRDMGQGDAGRVFEAVHTFTRRAVALKVVAAEAPTAEKREKGARLTREAQALAALRHPGVVEVLDGGHLPNGAPYLVMELLEGRTLEGLIAARGKVTTEDTVAVAIQLADALAAAHAAGIVHRDVKPSNVLVVTDHARRELIKLVDFGLARVQAAADKLTGIAAVIGTAGYTAPEQLLGLDDVDARSDVYALGVTMFECLTGRLPYEGNYQQVLLQACSSDPEPRVEAQGAVVPPKLAAVINRAMAKDRVARFPSMSELRAALRESLPPSGVRGETYFFSPPPASASSPPAEQRRKLVRASYVTPVRLLMGDVTIDGRTEDISTGGLLVICRQLCPADRTGSLRFALPIEGKIVSVDVHVRWSRAARAGDPEGPRALGLEFIDPPKELTASIAKYVSFMTVPEAD